MSYSKIYTKKILAKKLPISILKYYAGLSETHSEEIESVLNYLRNNPKAVFPYDFQNQYIAGSLAVFNDHDKGLRYVLLDGKKMKAPYFRRGLIRAERK